MVFAAPPADLRAVNAEALANLNTFAQQFLGKRKLISGDLPPCIADYKCGTTFWFSGHQVVRAKTGLELPQRIKTYVEDFLAAIESKDCLDAADEFLKGKAS
mmetsp:Transcript_61536/g.170629  ORF Transcript_61536/g.170629 Transcript_61536/m.170629 type:complete len:102 (+) Transcript_61536:3-308(+)